MKGYVTIKSNVVNTIEINKSRFVTYAYNVNDVNEVATYLSQVKKTHYNATHHCYAYVLNDTSKFSDDGEPSGTAGQPILEVINKKGLCNVLVVVVRYFGGVKLGAGGLVRAYGGSCSQALELSEIVTYEVVDIVTVEVNYAAYNVIGSKLNQSIAKIDNVTFGEQVSIELACKLNCSNKLLSLLQEWTGGAAKPIVVGQKVVIY